MFLVRIKLKHLLIRRDFGRRTSIPGTFWTACRSTGAGRFGRFDAMKKMNQNTARAAQALCHQCGIEEAKIFPSSIIERASNKTATSTPYKRAKLEFCRAANLNVDSPYGARYFYVFAVR